MNGDGAASQGIRRIAALLSGILNAKQAQRARASLDHRFGPRVRTLWDVESFNGKLREELRNGGIFYTLTEAKILIERWRVHYNGLLPRIALDYGPQPRRPSPRRTAAGCAPWRGD